MVGLPLHNTPFPGVLMKSIGAAFFDRRTSIIICLTEVRTHFSTTSAEVAITFCPFNLITVSNFLRPPTSAGEPTRRIINKYKTILQIVNDHL